MDKHPSIWHLQKYEDTERLKVKVFKKDITANTNYRKAEVPILL